ncbi:hypothetical protein C8Q79DRAFT_1010083 [Trametes meyenii]|nr:hypothetical protein C8Q79DRAFT_1010083 [Trametes meyenii]
MDSPTRPAFVYTFDATTKALRSALMRIPGGCDESHTPASQPLLLCPHFSTLPALGEDMRGLSVQEVRLARRDFVYFLERKTHGAAESPRHKRERKRETRQAKKVVREVELLARRLEAEMSDITNAGLPDPPEIPEGRDLEGVEGEELKRDEVNEFCICGALNHADGSAIADDTKGRTSTRDASCDIDMLWAHREVALLIKDMGDCMDALDISSDAREPYSATNVGAYGLSTIPHTPYIVRHGRHISDPFALWEVPASHFQLMSEVEVVPEDHDDKAVLKIKAADVEREPDRFVTVPRAGTWTVNANVVLNTPEPSSAHKPRRNQRRSRTSVRAIPGRTRAGRKARAQALGTSAP